MGLPEEQVKTFADDTESHKKFQRSEIYFLIFTIALIGATVCATILLAPVPQAESAPIDESKCFDVCRYIRYL